MEKTEKREKDLGVAVFPSAFSLILWPPIPGKLDLKWENIFLTLLFNGAMTQYREGWKLHHVSVRSLCLSEWRLLIYNSDTSYSLLLSAWSFLLEFFHLSFHLSPCFCSSPLVSSPVLSSLPSCHFVYIWKADRAFGSHSNGIKCVSVSVHVRLKSRGWFAALPLQL